MLHAARLLHLRLLELLKRELQITVGTAGSQLLAAKLQTVSAMGTAGHQPPAPDLSGQCQTSTPSSRSQWVLPDLNRERQKVSARGQTECHKECQIECHHMSEYVSDRISVGRDHLKKVIGGELTEYPR